MASSIGARRRARSLRWRVWPLGGAVALAAAVIVVVALGVSLLLPPAQPAAAPSATRTTLSAPPPTATAVASPTGPWRTLVSSSGAGGAWSPDGAYLAVWSVSASGTNQDMRLVDSKGTLVRSLDADRFAWLDARSFVLVRGGAPLLGSATSGVLSPVLGSFSGDLLSSYRGAITVTTPVPSDPSSVHFVVWTPQGASASVSGQPVAWSPDGTEIAVWRPRPRTGAVGVGQSDTGTVDILAWPGLATLAHIPDGSLVAPASFDPTGRYLLVSRLGLAGSFIFDLATGKSVGPASIGGSGTTGIAWSSGGDLLVSGSDGSVTTYHIPSAAGVRQTGLGDLVESSSSGSTTVFAFSQDYTGSPRPITLIRDGSTTTVSVPGGLVSGPSISADGSGVVVFCLIDHGGPSEHTEALLLVG